MAGRRTTSIDDKIENQQNKVIRAKAAYEAEVEKLEKLFEKMDAIRKEKFLEGILKKAFQQVDADNYKYPKETNREGKVIILSKHSSDISIETVYEEMHKGFLSAQHKGYVTGKVELWIGKEIYTFN